MTPAVACGYYNSGHEIKAGNPLEFYIGIDLFYDLKIMLDWALVFFTFQMQIVDRNPGSETLLIKYQIPLENNSVWYGLIVKLDITNPPKD